MGVIRLTRTPARVLAIALAAVALVCGCASGGRNAENSGIPRALLLEARPIGHGAAFHPPARGPILGRCSRRLGPRSGVHVELFAANRVVLVAAGIGVRRPLSFSGGRISGAACFGDLVTLEPTGVVLVRPAAKLSLAGLFRSWGQPLSRRRVAAFAAPAGTSVSVFVNGRRWRGSPAAVPLVRHWEIVLEVGPHVPPHSSYTFPPGV